jgi:transglutaminase-like putative cysteine protease
MRPFGMLRSLALSALALLCARTASAQASGSPLPLVPSDSVLRLAVDPARAGGAPFVVLLQESSFRVEADGRWQQRNRRAVQVVDESAARGLAEQAFAFASSHQTLTIEWVRVLRTTGVVVADKPAQMQDADVPAAMANPIYQDQRVRRLSLAGVTAGTVVDIAWTLKESAPPRAGDFLFRAGLNGPVAIRRALIELDVPEGYAPTIVERNLTVSRRDDIANGRRRYTWTASDQPGIRAESFAADSNGVVQTITVGPRSTWTEIATWYHGLSKDRYALSTTAATRVDSLVRASGARTTLDTIRAVHRFVAQDIRYLSVALGMGSYQPRTPDDVLSTALGDCKDKTTLFVAALRRYRLAANPVLLSLSQRPDPNVPTVFQFNHAIAAVRDGAGWVYTDLTAESIPYGELPESYQGSFALLVSDDGAAQRITLPVRPTAQNVSSLQITMQLGADGRATGRAVERAEGAPTYGLRMGLSTPLDSARRASLSRSLMQRIFGAEATGSLRVDSLVVFDGRDLLAPAQLAYAVSADEMIRTIGSAKLLAVPSVIRGPARSFRTALRELESRGPRQLPIDASRILAPITNVTEWIVTLPPGWNVELPANVSATSFFGSYSSTWTQNGRELRQVRRLQGQRGIFGPERIAEVLVWLRTVGADDQDFLPVKPTSAP